MDVVINTIEETGTPDNDYILVLDDYHLIMNKEIHDALLYLLSHVPLHLHLVISTRADPPIHLSRMRACGELTEIRLSELRFTKEEEEMFLTRIIGLTLDRDESTVLHHRTEGWISGIQLAALSLKGRTDISSFLQAFTGSNRFIPGGILMTL